LADIILIVDDEESVRRTFHEWLAGASLGCDILSAADASEALKLANTHTIDLAILDWHLGAGNHGLQLLEDLCIFNPDVVAIMVTGFAHQATPLDAMRMGVRDYLDKNTDLKRETFLAAVRKQLDRLRPAKRQRQLQRALLAFRDAVQKVVPLVSTTAAMNDPVPITESIRSLFGFLRRTTQAGDGVLVVRSYEAARQPAEICRVYDMEGAALDVVAVPFSQSLASAVVSMQDACALADLDSQAGSLGIQLQSFEKGRRHVLAAPMTVSPGLTVVVELFDKQPGDKHVAIPFTEEDRRLVSAAGQFAAHMIRQALAERHLHAMLVEAMGAALQASEQMTAAPPSPPDQPPPEPVLNRLRQSIEESALSVVEAPEALKLAELLRELSVRHGPAATRFCVQMLEGVDRLLRGDE
jgi:ActR/RegA family two-component response regulator